MKYEITIAQKRPTRRIKLVLLNSETVWQFIMAYLICKSLPFVSLCFCFPAYLAELSHSFSLLRISVGLSDVNDALQYV